MCYYWSQKYGSYQPDSNTILSKNNTFLLRYVFNMVEDVNVLECLYDYLRKYISGGNSEGEFCIEIGGYMCFPLLK